MIEVNHIAKSYGEEKVLRDISFRLGERQTLSVLGKSGCGKTTLLKIMAGLETADSGRFILEEKNLLELAPQQRGVVYLSQEPLLFPHLDVFQNLAYGLKIRKMDKKTIEKRTERLAKSLDLGNHLSKMPHQLSGGQKQRVNFGRALNINPAILLLDEPFGSLDVQTRAEMQELFRRIREEFTVTSLFITHDLKEALLMGDQVARLENGEMQVFERIDDFVASPDSGVASELEFWKKIAGKPV